MNRICPLPFEKDSARYYRIKGCIEACKEPVTETGTVFSDKFGGEYIHVTTKTGVDRLIRIK